MYVTYTTLVSNCTNHVFLMSSVNRYRYVPVRFSFVVAYWIRTHGVIGSNADTPVFSPLCSRYVVIFTVCRELLY
jgi:hypothetical protein